ncbi:MAG: M28 family peptidase [Nitrospira sp.]|nr:M28 family peptidase [Nitrospira sp.]TKB75886.1 MAG: M28 family peptidase [Nitrospira sp.]
MNGSTRCESPSFVFVILLGVILALLPIGTQVFAQSEDDQRAWLQALDSLSNERMLADIRTLSSPDFNGRQAGTADDLRSAQWFARELTAGGVTLPLIDNSPLAVPFPNTEKGIQRGLMASMVSTSLIAPDPVVRTGTADQLVTAQLSRDYLPVFDSPSADLQGQVVFVGYGIVDPAQGIDDYAGVDVKNSIALFLRGKPNHYPNHVSHADKIRFARDRGALAYLTAIGPILSPYEIRRGVTGRPSAFYGQLPPNQALPGAWISTELAETLLAGSGDESNPDRLRTFQEQLNNAPSARSRLTNRYASLHWKTTIEDGLLTNVVGLIPGTGPDTIVIGAHRDHFGRPAGLWFPGADDNASGTAVILEVARALGKTGLRPQRTILFLSFSGEERDLLGSRLYTSRPHAPLSSTKAMINIDHAGAGNGRLTVGITGLEKTTAQEAGQAAGLTDKLDLYGFFPGGDHVPFKEAGIPTVTIVSGGVHPDFHQPTDTGDKVQPDTLKSIARFATALAWKLANLP